MNERYIHLGSGVFLDHLGAGPEQAFIEGRIRHRFMDALYLPSQTHLLEANAIRVINKWRDEQLVVYPLLHRDRVRRIGVAVGRVFCAPRVLEIGCGGYPIAAEVGASAYVGLDIDPAAAQAATALGVRVVTTPLEIFREATEVDIVFSLFAMQFAIDDDTLNLIELIPNTAIAFFNLPTRDNALAETRVRQIESRGLATSILDLTAAGPKDRLVLAGKSEAALVMAKARRAAQMQACAEWPLVGSEAIWQD
ncbi:hypothetical protein [Mesorhizobium sp.]|uniref:hypothetical protein n=1 Tax=Mesorhizobium sp. TaxID=1871066 RepID=UPI000FE5E6A4|nr:hypothetical protein [Mesorhizobium sp.]RWC53043.1 MAG: hypothetical protein EOS56_31250 [Mesorhizobium sp.]RWC53571.1 MAG: hypothetical protein EOS29_29650 [Mesorhizobium sp.]